MERIRTEFEVTVSDFRKASYYGMFLQYRKPLRIMFVVLGVAIIYGVAGYLGAGQVNYWVFFLAVAYLIWGLLMFARTERQILRYVKMPGSFVGCRYVVTIDTHRITFEIPERKINASNQLNKLPCAFELNDLFLIYVSTQQTFILPCRALTEAQRQEFRRTLRERLGDNFGSRFDRKKSK